MNDGVSNSPTRAETLGGPETGALGTGPETFGEESFDDLLAEGNRLTRALQWGSIFVLPPWLRAWWRIFGEGARGKLFTVRSGGSLVEFVPLLLRGQEARLMGSEDVCDYLDCVTAPTRRLSCVPALISRLLEEGVRTLDLGLVRADSVVLRTFVPTLRQLGYEPDLTPEEVCVERELPATWNEFLYSLSGKERHEIRRKWRRLQESGPVRFRVFEKPGEIDGPMETFLRLFPASRPEKAEFLTERRAAFFREAAREMAVQGMFRLTLLELDGEPAASVMCFDDGSTVYLYNNGYDPRFRHLSVGLVSKLFTVRDSLERGRSKYDFLKGGEPYKFRLGGRAVPLYRCRVSLA
jgi:CelD/BcsL family acetyltransferase involved in cellulose biosynthesis